MSKDIGSAIESICRYRDRFSAWGLVVTFIAVIAALWTTAPALNVEIPLVGSVKVGLNVGYILIAGIPLLMLAMAWIVVPLIAMRRLQEAVVEELEASKGALEPTQLREFVGPFPLPGTGSVWRSSAIRFLAGVRSFVFFICPVIALLWISEEYFLQLYAFDRQKSIEELAATVEKDPNLSALSRWRIPSKERVGFAEYFFSSKAYSASGDELRYFALENSDLERSCAQIWMRDYLADQLVSEGHDPDWKRNLREELESRTSDDVCIVDAFPRFELAVNSWINIVSLCLAVWIAAVGFLAFRTKGLISRIGALTVVAPSTTEQNQVEAGPQ